MGSPLVPQYQAIGYKPTFIGLGGASSIKQNPSLAGMRVSKVPASPFKVHGANIALGKQIFRLAT